MTDTQTTWIIRSGQLWKLYVALAGFGGALILFTTAVFSLGSSGNRAMAFTACGVLLAVATFVWLTVSLRCPHCFAKLVWTMVTSRPHSSWLVDLAGLEACPVCRRNLGQATHSAR